MEIFVKILVIPIIVLILLCVYFAFFCIKKALKLFFDDKFKDDVFKKNTVIQTPTECKIPFFANHDPDKWLYKAGMKEDGTFFVESNPLMRKEIAKISYIQEKAMNDFITKSLSTPPERLPLRDATTYVLNSKTDNANPTKSYLEEEAYKRIKEFIESQEEQAEEIRKFKEEYIKNTKTEYPQTPERPRVYVDTNQLEQKM